MKNKFAQILMLVALTVGFSVFANAQTGPTHKANIPFDFIVGEKFFRAGEYTVNFGVSSIRDTMLLRSADGKHSAIVYQTVAKDSDENAKDGSFVFYVSKNHYYLAEVNTAQKSVELRSPQLKTMPDKRKYKLGMKL